MPNLCAGGCGKELPASNKSGFAWGHKNGCVQETKQAGGESDSAEESEEIPGVTVQMDMTEAQLNRIWDCLPVPEKTLAILTALQADRSEPA